MSLYNMVARHVLAPSLDRMRGTRTMQCLTELEESQWWPRERIEELQSGRLQQLMQHVYDSVPYYRHQMVNHGLTPSRIRSSQDLSRLPVLTKDIVRTQRNDLIAEGFPRGELRLSTTSGSTGTPLTFYGTYADQVNHGVARTQRALGWAGLKIGDAQTHVGRPYDYYEDRGSLSRNFGMRARRMTQIDPNSLTEEALPRIVSRLARARPHALTGYPSCLAVIAAFIEQAGNQPLTLKSVVPGGEQLTDQHRRLMTRGFSVEPYSKYSTSEVFDIASECVAHSGLHIAAEDMVVEIVDDDGMPVTQGQPGRVLVTNLHNYGMPLIRYDIGDTGTLLAETCPCGRELPRLGGLLGRNNTYLYTRSGQRISPGALYLDRLTSLPVLQYQIVQEDLDSVTMNLVLSTTMSPEELAALRKKVHAMFNANFGESIRFEVRFTDRITPGPAGKHTFVFSKVDPTTH